MNYRLISLLLIAALCPFLKLRAQYGRMFTSDDMLSNSLVNDIAQDSKGFIWIATQDGLNMYDGHRMQVFHAGDGSQLVSDRALTLFVGDEGRLYVGTGEGLQVFDPATRTFTTITPRDPEKPAQAYINHITRLSDGHLVYTTSGRGAFLLRQGETQSSDFQQPGGNYPRHIYEDRQHRIWVASQNDGLFLSQNGCTLAQFFNDDQHATILQVFEDGQGRLFAASMNNGIYAFDETTRLFRHLPATRGLRVSCLLTRQDGTILLGCDGDGLQVFHPTTGMVTTAPNLSGTFDFPKTKIHALLSDHQQNLWVGIFQKGVYLQPAGNIGFSTIGPKSASHNIIGNCCVMAVFCDSKSQLWVGTDNDGLYLLDAEGRLKGHYPQPATVLSITESGDGRIWVGTYTEGCGTIDGQGHYQRLALPREVAPAVYSICPDGDNLWLTTLGSGLVGYNLHTRETTIYRTPEEGITDDQQDVITSNYPLYSRLARDGHCLWITTSNALVAFDLRKRSFTSQFGRNCALRGQAYFQVYEDPQGRLWLGTTSGLIQASLRGEKVRCYTKDDGLLSNTINAITGDAHGHLWLSTNRGLSRLDPQTGDIVNFSASTGLQGNEFSARAVTQRDSLIFFGGVSGVSYFNPSRLQPTKKQLQVQLVSMQTDEQEVVAGMRSGSYTITDRAVIDADRFDLASAGSSFSLAFSAMDFTSPEQTQFEYYISSAPLAVPTGDNPWRSLGTGVSELNFSRLSPGTYYFHVRARNAGTISDERQFCVVVHPAWYGSWWFRLLLLAAAVAAVLLYLRYRRQQEREHLRLQEHIHAEEMSEAKLRFFMNISHEIRTPMTLIMTPLLSLIKQDTDPGRHSTYETIRRNAERILSLINQMMDLRKIDKGQMQMHMAETDLVGFVGDLHTLFDHQARAKHITLNYEHDMQFLPAWIDRRQFDKVIVNILSNAFKYTPTGGHITISLTSLNGKARLTVSDDGEKIPEGQLGHIFERFYQASTSTNDRQAGTGIGLDLTRSIVELHHGTIEAHNLDKGCAFTIEIPLGNDHLSEEEMLVEKSDVSSGLFSTDMLMGDDDTDTANLTQAEEPTEQKGNSKIRIVLAEDDDEIRQYLTTELSHDYEVYACQNGREALGETLRQHPALVISDVMMPEMDGYELCSQLKANPETGHVPVVLLTARSRDEDQLEGLETGADAYIVKPFNMDILRRTVGNLINSHHQLQMKYSKVAPLEELVDEIRMKSPDDKLLDRIMQSINTHLTDSDLSVDLIASEAGISRVHLHRKMKELTGQTPHDLIRSLRLKRAAQLLTQPGMNITEVTYACGFSNASTFSNVFKQFYGMSPRDYMREHEGYRPA